MTTAEILALFAYDHWARERTLQSVAPLPEALYLENLKSSHGGIHGTLLHLFGADTRWLQRWMGGTPSAFPTAEEIPTLHALRSRWQEYRARLSSFLGGLTDAGLHAPVSYADSAGNRHAEPLYQQMQHSVNHASYHRGQVVTMLRQLGAKPIGTDLITFYREPR